MNNPLLYNALLNGFSGGAVTNLWVPDLAASSFANTKAQAIAFATEVDSLIPTITNGATASQGQLLSAISQAIMNRPAVTGTLTYSDIAESIASMFNEITAALVSTENEIVVPVVLTPSGAGGFTGGRIFPNPDGAMFPKPTEPFTSRSYPARRSVLDWPAENGGTGA